MHIFGLPAKRISCLIIGFLLWIFLSIPQTAIALKTFSSIDNDVDQEIASSFLRSDNQWILDDQNRVVILHGVQIINSGPPYISYHTEEDYDRLVGWGFNSIRLGTVWTAIESEPGVYNEDYLQLLDERIGWCHERGIYVILEMHQDVYSEKYSGDGAPEWACIDNGIPFYPLQPWFLNYMQPAVMAAFNNFWSNTDGLQDYFVNMWTNIAARYVNEPAIAGYDLYNEPFFGSHLPLLIFDRQYLQPFYEKLISSIQEVSPNHISFFEPTGVVGAGLPCHMQEMGFSNIAYAPHCYPTLPNIFHIYLGNPKIMRQILRTIDNNADNMNVPVWVGEYALFDAQTVNAEQYLKDLCRVLDDFKKSWSYWIYNKDDNVGLLDLNGNERKWVVDVVSRPYPQKICGYPQQFYFNVDSKVFKLTWTENPEASGPTVIFVPQERHYPEGFSIRFSDPEGHWAYKWNADRNLLLIWADRNIHEHTLKIIPPFTPDWAPSID